MAKMLKIKDYNKHTNPFLFKNCYLLLSPWLLKVIPTGFCCNCACNSDRLCFSFCTELYIDIYIYNK